MKDEPQGMDVALVVLPIAGGGPRCGLNPVTVARNLGKEAGDRGTNPFTGQAVGLDLEWAAGSPGMKVGGQAAD